MERELLSVKLQKKVSKSTGKEYFLFSAVDDELGVIEDFLPVELVPNFKNMERQNYVYEVCKTNNRLSLRLVSIK